MVNTQRIGFAAACAVAHTPTAELLALCAAAAAR
jgi:hypothetical protein